MLSLSTLPRDANINDCFDTELSVRLDLTLCYTFSRLNLHNQVKNIAYI